MAVLEDGKVAEVYLERPERRSIAGNIYLGVVDNVLPGMEAAFVEIGLEKNGFLYVDEIVVPELEGKRQGKKITDLIQRGQQILVQAVKDPMKTKGARLTTEISLPGRFLVYVPYGEGLGVSRRLDDNERQRLKEILKELDPKQGGIIVRTAAQGASAEDIERDLVFLQRLWKTIQARAKAATTPELVYQEAELPLRIVRDLFAGDFLAAHVDDDRAYKRIVGYLKKTSPHMLERVHRDKEKERLFERFGVAKEIASTLERRVDLPSGGYLIFDYAEAFTVIDVNTGRFVGSRSKNTAQRLEDTIVKNNLEAVKEVVRQLRLRDIGGIIVIDFIDMANPKNRHAVEEALRTELERDRTKTYVVEISPLGLVEMTRQNVTDGPREVMTRRCPTCAGDGIVVSEATAALEVERRLRELAGAGAGTRVQAYRVAVHPRVLPLLAGPGGERLAELEERLKRRFFLVAADGHAHTDHLEVARRGQARRPAASVVAPGGRGARGEAGAGRPPRRRRRCRQGGRCRRGRRRRRKARGEEGARHRRPRARRAGLREHRRRRWATDTDHLRERGGEADTCPGTPTHGDSGRGDPWSRWSSTRETSRSSRPRTTSTPSRWLPTMPSHRTRTPWTTAPRTRRGAHDTEEEDAAWLTRRQAAEEACGRRRRDGFAGTGRRRAGPRGRAGSARARAAVADGDAPATASPERAPRPRQRRPRQPKIHVPATGLGEAETAAADGDATPAAVAIEEASAAPESSDDCGRDRRRQRSRTRGPRGEEEDPPRLARRSQPPQEAGCHHRRFGGCRRAHGRR